MENTTMKEAAMNAVRGICTRLWRGANTGHAGTFRSEQGTTVPFAGDRARDMQQLTDLRIAVARTVAPITGVVYPRLEAPPV